MLHHAPDTLQYIKKHLKMYLDIHLIFKKHIITSGFKSEQDRHIDCSVFVNFSSFLQFFNIPSAYSALTWPLVTPADKLYNRCRFPTAGACQCWIKIAWHMPAQTWTFPLSVFLLPKASQSRVKTPKPGTRDAESQYK